MSALCHHMCRFYAQNITLLPVYNRIHTKVAVYRPNHYDGDSCTLDPDLPIYRQNWIEFVAQNFRREFEIDNWCQLSMSGINIRLDEWLHLPLFLREAVKLSGNHLIHEQQKQNEQVKKEMERKLEESQEHRSAFEGIPKPSFFQQ